jgi:anti-sigma regulatory factor (Ser/Thr protein kinase)
MANSATETTSLMTVTLPSTRYSAWMARYYVRAALREHGLDAYASDAAVVTSELVTNAIIHTDATKIGLELGYLQESGMLAITVTDSSPALPEKRDVDSTAQRGRGLLLVEALSAHWGWRSRHPGKAVYAILTTEA